MAFELRIFMVDLIAFARQGEDIWALLLNSPRRRMASDRKFIADHHPILILPTGGTDEDEFPTIKGLLGLKRDKNGRGWLLDREDVIVEATTQAAVQPGPLSAGDPAKALLPNASNRTSFDWVPKMEKVSPESGLLDGSFLGTEPPNKVTARLKLNLKQAALETFAFTKLEAKGAIEIKPFSFVNLRTGNPAGDPQERAVADVVVARLRVSGDSATIRSQKYDLKANPRKPVELKSSAGGTVDILLANLSPNRARPNVDPFGRHFELYYGLTTTPQVIGPVPFLGKQKGTAPGIEPAEPQAVLQMEERDDTIGALNRPICTFVQFGG